MSKPSPKRNQKKKDREKKVQAQKNRPEPGIGQAPRKDPYRDERALRRIFRAREGRPFGDPQELEHLLDEERPLAIDLSGLQGEELAQELAFQGLAWLADSHRKAPEKAMPLLKRALEVDPDCADAHVGLLYLAGLEGSQSLSPETAPLHLKALLAASRRRLGLSETGELPDPAPQDVFLRPHLRLLDAAVLQAEDCDLLELCPQWCREILLLDPECEQAEATRVLTWLLFGNFLAEAETILDLFELEDPTLFWWRAFASFRAGDRDAAAAWRNKAIGVAAHSQRLLALEILPEEGEEFEEDFFLVHEPLMLALQHEGEFLDWLDGLGE
jgi:tetratricopeptide (TPR) repeat protein